MNRISGILRNIFILMLQLGLLGVTLFSFAGSMPEINVMAPLYVGRLHAPNDAAQEESWIALAKDLKAAKQVGVTSVTTDIWWGLVEGHQPGHYDWSFYDRLSGLIRASGLRWVPILSMHQLGGNVGDIGYIPIPSYLWTRYTNDPSHFHDIESMKFRSEQGNYSNEYVSFWATPVILDDIKRFMTAFRDHFANQSDIVEEINISLGPSGELRYPSYNQHDKGAVYPTRGAIQAYSTPAIAGFRHYVIKKYGTLNNVIRSWGFPLSSVDNIFPPNPRLLKGQFWVDHEQFTPYGKDFFDYYNQVLIDHGKLMFSTAESVFGSAQSPFQKVLLSGKIPGIHWKVASNRAAELCAGLIRSSYANWFTLDAGYGYHHTLSVFQADPKDTMPRQMTFTALEMNDHRDEELGADSRAKTLVGWIAQSAKARGIVLTGENALGSELNNPVAWNNMAEAMSHLGYQKITLLRLNEIATDTHRLHLLKEFRDRVLGAGTPPHVEAHDPMQDLLQLDQNTHPLTSTTHLIVPSSGQLNERPDETPTKSLMQFIDTTTKKHLSSIARRCAENIRKKATKDEPPTE